MRSSGYQIWVVPLNLAGVLMDPVEQGKLEVLGVVVSEFSAVSPLVGLCHQTQFLPRFLNWHFAQKL